MTKIMPIGGPRIPIDFFEFEQADFILLGKVLAFVLFIIFTQWLLDKILKKGTPFYSKDDKKSPIYHIVTATVVSMMLFTFGWSMELIMFQLPITQLFLNHIYLPANNSL